MKEYFQNFGEILRLERKFLRLGLYCANTTTRRTPFCRAFATAGGGSFFIFLIIHKRTQILRKGSKCHKPATILRSEGLSHIEPIRAKSLRKGRKASSTGTDKGTQSPSRDAAENHTAQYTHGRPCKANDPRRTRKNRMPKANGTNRKDTGFHTCSPEPCRKPTSYAHHNRPSDA